MEPTPPPTREHRRLLRGRLLEWAYELDAWLKQRLGRPYTAILGVGLTLGIIATVKSLKVAIETGHNPYVLAGTVVFEAALLINQLAQFHEYRQHVRARRRAKSDAKRSPKA